MTTKQSSSRFPEVEFIVSVVYFDSRTEYCYKKALWTHGMKQLVYVYVSFYEITLETPVTLLAFSDKLKDTFLNFGVCVYGAGQVLVELCSGDAMEVYKAKNVYQISPDTNVCHEASPVVINTINQRILTK